MSRSSSCRLTAGLVMALVAGAAEAAVTPTVEAASVPTELKGAVPLRPSAPLQGPTNVRYASRILAQGYATEVEPNGTSATASPLAGTNLVPAAASPTRPAAPSRQGPAAR